MAEFNKQILSFALWGIGVIFLFAILYFFMSKKEFRDKKILNLTIIYVFMLAILLRIIILLMNKSNSIDLGYFKDWSKAVYQYGLLFYDKLNEAEKFIDYPPGYLPILYVAQFIIKTFSITSQNIMSIIFKMPLLIFDLLGGLLVLKVAQKKIGKLKILSVILCAFYLFCPPILVDSGFWGQVDTVIALLIGLSFYYLYEEKPIAAAIAYTCAVLVKPQPLLILPVFLFFIIEQICIAIKNRRFKYLIKVISGVGIAAGIFTLVGYAFNPERHIFWLIDLYIETMGSYKMTSLGAMNIYGALDLIGKPTDTMILGMKSSMLSTLSIVIGIIISGLFVFLGKQKTKYLSAATSIYILLFTFATGMHERYLIVILLSVLLLAVYNGKRLSIYFYYIFSLVSFFAITRSIISYWKGINTDSHIVMIIFSAIMVFGCLSFVVYRLIEEISIKRKV